MESTSKKNQDAPIVFKMDVNIQSQALPRVQKSAPDEGKITGIRRIAKLPLVGTISDLVIENRFKQLEEAHHFFDDISEIKITAKDEKRRKHQLGVRIKAIKGEIGALEKALERQKERQKKRKEKEDPAKETKIIKNTAKTVGVTTERIAEKKQQLLNMQQRLAAPEPSPREELVSLYKKLFRLCEAIRVQLEAGYSEVGNSYLDAYKVLVYFGDPGFDFDKTVGVFISYVRNLKFDSSRILIGNMFSNITLPKDGRLLQLNGWREFFSKRTTLGSLKLFEDAPEIEKLRAKEKYQPEGSRSSPESFEEALILKMHLIYPGWQQYPNLARICFENNVQGWVFNRCLELSKRRKKNDILPNVVLERRVNGAKEPDYCLVKLPFDDPRAYIIGEVTDCCQSIGKVGERYATDAIIKEEQGYYVLLHNVGSKSGENMDPVVDGKINYDCYEIVGDGYAWVSESGNLVIDSWENLRSARDDTVVVGMLEKFAEVMIDKIPGISRVMIGIGMANGGCKTPWHFVGKTPAFRDVTRDGHVYNDSSRQVVVCESKILIENRKLVEGVFKGYALPLDKFVSCVQVETFLKFVRDSGNLKIVKSVLDKAKKLGLTNYGSLVAHPYTQHLVDLKSFYEKVSTILDEIKEKEVLEQLISDEALSAYGYGIGISVLKGFDAQKICALVSYRALEAYKSNLGIKFDELKEYGSDEIFSMTDFGVLDVCRAGIKFTGLVGLVKEKKLSTFLTYNQPGFGCLADACMAGATFEELSEVFHKDPAKFRVLIPWVSSQDGYELKIYKMGIKFGDLKDLGVEEIKALICQGAVELYERSKIKFSELRSLKGLTTKKVSAICQLWKCMSAVGVGVKIGDFEDLDDEKIEIFSGYEGEEVAKICADICRIGVKFEELKKMNVKDFRAFTLGAKHMYMDGYTFEDLKNLLSMGQEKFYALTSDAAVKAYETKKVRFDDLKSLSVDEIKVFISAGVLFAYKEGKSFQELKKMYEGERKKFDALLMSDGVLVAYNAGAKFSDLESLYTSRQREFNILMSREARAVYGAGAKFSRLREIFEKQKDRFDVITSEGAIKLYKKGLKFGVWEKEKKENHYDYFSSSLYSAYGPGFSERKDKITITEVPLKEIKEFIELADLVTEDIIAASRSVSIRELTDLLLKEKNKEKIKALTSWDAMFVVDKISFRDLWDFDVDTIKKLTSKDAQEVYQKGGTIEDLKDVKSEDVKNKFLSDGAYTAYYRGAKPKDIKKLLFVDKDEDKFKLLVSEQAEKAYDTKVLNFVSLMNLDVELIEKLISGKSIERYKNGEKFASVKEDESFVLGCVIS